MGKKLKIAIALTGLLELAVLKNQLEPIYGKVKSNERTQKAYVMPVDKSQTRESLSQAERLDYKTEDFSEDTDEVLLARMIFGEARGLSEIEKIAVGYTAVNRANDNVKWNGSDVRSAVLKSKQYSCFNSNDPNREKLMNPMDYEPSEFIKCLDISRKILDGTAEDFSNGATHYFNPSVVSPSWKNRMHKIGKIDTGNKLSVHEFYKE